MDDSVLDDGYGIDEVMVFLFAWLLITTVVFAVIGVALLWFYGD